ncbi:MAG: putative peptidoglycan glycosyltransferase FtsW [Pseudomonadota bacterium]
MANAISLPYGAYSVRTWWTSLDRSLLYTFFALITIGIVLVTAAGPVAAMRKGIDNPLHFVERQFIFLIPAMIIMAGASLLTVTQTRRAGALACLGALGLMVLTVLIGPEIKGSTRWLPVAGFGLQPSEFFKPAFVLTAAWFQAEGARDHKFPGGALSRGLYGIAAILLILQPDYGQLILLTAIWGVMFFIAGWSWSWLLGLGGVMGGVLAFGYNFAPHVRSRIDRFLSPQTGDTYQVDSAMEVISSGGFLGHDLNHASSVKASLPDAHTDFIFAVAGEEFGFVLCLLILGLFAWIVLRSLMIASGHNSIFMRCAVVGLSAQMAFQAIVNVGVNLAVLPAKGMTLPFISCGGSSLLATALTAGWLLALTRQEGAR